MTTRTEREILDRLVVIETRLTVHAEEHRLLMSSFENAHRRLDEIVQEIVDRLKHLPKGDPDVTDIR